MTKNLMKKIGVGAVLVGALAGTAYGGTKEDLDAIRDSVKRHPATKIWDVRINGGPKFKSYEFQKNGVTVETNKSATLFKNLVNGKITYACDHENDGDLDRIVILRGDTVSKPDDSFARQECLGKGSLDTELSMNDMFQRMKGKNPYNTRVALDVNEGKSYDFKDGESTKLPQAGKIADGIYKNTLKGIKTLLN